MYRRLLFASDLSETNFSLIPKIKQLVKLFDAQLTLLHVVEPPPAYCAPALNIFHEDVITYAKQTLQRMTDELGVTESATMIEMGSAKHEIIRVVQQLDIDLILLGRHGRHGFSKWLGSSVGSIIQAAQCDVMILTCCGGELHD